MSGKQLTGTLEGILDGLLDGNHSSASLSLSGQLMIKEQAVPVTARGMLSPPEGHVRPARGIALGTLDVTAQDSDANLIVRLAIDGNGGEFITDGSFGLFRGIQAGSFLLEQGTTAADGTLPIKMIFQRSSTVETSEVTGEFALVAQVNGDVFSFKKVVEIELTTGDVLTKHNVVLDGQVTRNQSPGGLLKFESNEGELGVVLTRGQLEGFGGFHFDWKQFWATGIFKGSKRGGLGLKTSIIDINEYNLVFRFY